MKTSNFSTLEGLINVPTGDTNYLTVQYSKQGLVNIGWFTLYGPVPSGQSGQSMNIIRFENTDGTTCDLYLPMNWITTSGRKWSNLELPLQTKSILIVSVAGTLGGGEYPNPN